MHNLCSTRVNVLHDLNRLCVPCKGIISCQGSRNVVRKLIASNANARIRSSISKIQEHKITHQATATTWYISEALWLYSNTKSWTKSENCSRFHKQPCCNIFLPIWCKCLSKQIEQFWTTRMEKVPVEILRFMGGNSYLFNIPVLRHISKVTYIGNLPLVKFRQNFVGNNLSDELFSVEKTKPWLKAIPPFTTSSWHGKYALVGIAIRIAKALSMGYPRFPNLIAKPALLVQDAIDVKFKYDKAQFNAVTFSAPRCIGLLQGAEMCSHIWSWTQELHKIYSTLWLPIDHHGSLFSTWYPHWRPQSYWDAFRKLSPLLTLAFCHPTAV